MVQLTAQLEMMALFKQPDQDLRRIAFGMEACGLLYTVFQAAADGDALMHVKARGTEKVVKICMKKQVS